MLKLGGGIVLLMVSVFMTIGFLAGGASHHTLATQIVAFLIAAGIPGAGAFALLRGHLRERRGLPPRGPDAFLALPRERWSAQVIKLAAEHGGRLTLLEAVAELSFTPEEAQSVFDELCTRGIAEPQVTDSGLVVYAFRDLLLLDEKHESRGLLES